MTKNIFVPSNIPLGVFALVYNKLGGSYERIGERGVSHLMEHLICKTFDNTRETLSSLGLDYNAYTSDNQVVIWFSGLTENLEKVSSLLYERIIEQPILWTKDMFENEKSTVLQEYGDTFNSQESGFYHNIFREHYNYTGAIGYRADVENVSYEQSLEYVKMFKIPSTIVQVDKEFITSIDNKEHTGFTATDKLVFSYYDTALEPVPQEDKVLVGLLGINPVKADIGVYSLFSFLLACINDGLESPLFTEIREKNGLSYYSTGYINSIKKACIPMFFASTTHDNTAKLEKIYRDFFKRDGKDVILLDRFNACKSKFLIKEKMSKILPHSGVFTTVIAEDENPFVGISSLEYKDCISKYNEFFNNESEKVFIPIKY